MLKEDDEAFIHDSIFSLERMTVFPGEFRLPPTASPAELPTESMMLVSEKEGGISPFLRWLTKKNWTPGRLKVSDLKNKDFKTMEEQGNMLIDHTYFDPTITSTSNGRNEEELSGALSGLFESDLLHKKIIFLTHDTVNLFERGWFSVPVSRIHIYKVSTFSSLALKTLLESKGMSNDDSALCAQAIFENFGGQYTLTKHFLCSIELDSNITKTKEGLTNYRKNIEVSPPSYVFRWLDQLKMLLGDPETKELLASYVDGSQKNYCDFFSHREVQLYLAGWLQDLGNKHIGLRSILHRSLAIRALQGASK